MTAGRALGAALLGTIAGLAAAACGSSGSSVAGAGVCQGQTGVASATTATYAFVLDVGPVEPMYSEADVQAQHITSGEVMLSGAMSTASGPNAQHLEVHICRRDTGAELTGAAPSILLADTTDRVAPRSIPVAEMEGIGQGARDDHYGNNVILASGHGFTITVRVDGETATLDYTAPATGVQLVPSLAAPTCQFIGHATC